MTADGAARRGTISYSAPAYRVCGAGLEKGNLAHLSKTHHTVLCHKIKSRMREFPEAYWAF